MKEELDVLIAENPEIGFLIDDLDLEIIKVSIRE
jgi:hypothetical protein